MAKKEIRGFYNWLFDGENNTVAKSEEMANNENDQDVFTSMIIETRAHELNMPVEKYVEILVQTIKDNPMEFE